MDTFLFLAWLITMSPAGGTLTYGWTGGGWIAIPSATPAPVVRLAAADPARHQVLVIAGGVLVGASVALYFFEPKWTGNDDRRLAEGEGHEVIFTAAPVDGGGAAVLAGRF